MDSCAEFDEVYNILHFFVDICRLLIAAQMQRIDVLGPPLITHWPKQGKVHRDDNQPQIKRVPVARK